MGQVVQLGQSTGATAGRVASAGLLTAAGYDPEPISASVMAAIGLALKFFKFGYDPKKLNDTALTESLIIGFNRAWEQITGEQLPSACEPGQCGKQRQAIFTRSQWPNVPFPGGKPGLDIGQYRAGFEQAIAEGRAKLQRQESVADYEANANYVRTLLQQVQERQAQEQAANPLASLLPGLDISALTGGGVGGLLPWALGGLLVYKLIL